MKSASFDPKWGALVIIGLGVALLNLGLWRGDTSVQQYIDLKRSEDVLSETVQDLEDKNSRLEQEIDRLAASPDYARKVLRDRYHVTDSGEKIVFFADEGDEPQAKEQSRE